MGDQSAGYLHRNEDLRPGDHHGRWILVALHGSHGKFPPSHAWNQYPAWLRCSSRLFRPVLLFRMELSELRNRGAKGSLQVTYRYFHRNIDAR